MKRFMKSIALTLVAALLATAFAMPMEQVFAAKKANVTKIALTKPNASTLILKSGKSFTLKASVSVKPNTKKNRAVAYASNKPKVVSVDKKGKLTAVGKKGTAVITLRSAVQPKKSVKLKVRIGTPVTKVSLSKKDASLYTGDSLNLSKSVTVSPKKASIRKIAWSSTKTKVATVKNGVVKAKGPGITDIYAKATDGSGKKAVCRVTVYAWKTKTVLKDVYKDDFLVGVAIPARDLLDDTYESSRLARYHFNSITAENDMKPESLLDWPASSEKAAKGDDTPVLRVDNMDKMLDYAKSKNLKVRFHTLVWFSQTPEWFFHEKYETDQPLASAEVMKKRMESYITQIIDHVETKYPGLVYAWDVVNEAVDTNNPTSSAAATADKEHFNMRTENNFWYKTIGWEYVKFAFQYAKAAMKKNNGAGKLFYNDFMERTMRNEIIAMLQDVNKDEKLCDGMGCQAHFNMNGQINYQDYYLALLDYQAAGFEIHITELDIMVPDNYTNADFDTQASYFRTFFDMFRNVPAVTSVTLWGVNDAASWRGANYPLLFDADLTPKKAFYGAIQDPSIPLLAYK